MLCFCCVPSPYLCPFVLCDAALSLLCFFFIFILIYTCCTLCLPFVSSSWLFFMSLIFLHENAAFGNSVSKRCSRNKVIVLIFKDHLLNKLIFIKSHCKGAVSLVAGQLPASAGISWWDTRILQWQKILSWIVNEAQMVVKHMAGQG